MLSTINYWQTIIIMYLLEMKHKTLFITYKLFLKISKNI